jgi:anti-sigma regulatory factor (Ser/Thr protein kinase)
VSDVVTLQLPRERDFFGVAHLVLGGLGARFDLTYDVLEDMTTALDELMDRRESTEEVTLEVCVEGGALTATVGPFGGRVADELHASDAGLGLRRVLETVVDGVSVSRRDGAHWVELEKRLEQVPDGG